MNINIMEEKNLFSLINTTQDIQELDVLFNVYFVYTGARESFLLESANFLHRPDTISVVNSLLLISYKMGLLSCMENATYKRYFIAKSKSMANYITEVSENPELMDDILGKYLGFVCLGQDYSNLNIDRTAVNYFITDTNKKIIPFKAFVCESTNVNEKVIHSIEQDIIYMTNKINKDITITYELTEFKANSIFVRIDNLENSNLNYIQNNYINYSEDLYNYWTSYPNKLKQLFEKAKDSPKLYKKYKNIFTTIWNLFIAQNMSTELEPEITGNDIILSMKEFDELLDRTYGFILSEKQVLDIWDKFVTEKKSSINKQTRLVDVHVKYIRPEYTNLSKWIEDPSNVYIGRGGVLLLDTNGKGKQRYPTQSSIWANPFKLNKDGTLEEIISKYEIYIRKKLSSNEISKEELDNLKGKTLGCWCVKDELVFYNKCKKYVCHGEIILKILHG
jgi:hypothetical protein